MALAVSKGFGVSHAHETRWDMECLTTTKSHSEIFVHRNGLDTSA